MKKIKLLLLVAALTMVGSFTACGESAPKFEFSESVPVSASLYQEINFKNCRGRDKTWLLQFLNKLFSTNHNLLFFHFRF